MIFTGLDLGMTLTGFCTGSGERLPTAGVWRMLPVGADLGALIDQFDQALAAHIDQHRPDCVAYEAPILLRRDALLTLRKTYSLGAHLEWTCRRRGIECSEVDLRAVKLELAGMQSASKEDMTAAAEKVGLVLPSGPGREDAADAFGVFLLLLRARSRLLSSRFDAALYGGRANSLL